MLDEAAASNVPAIRPDFDPETATTAELVEYNATTKVPSPPQQMAKLMRNLSDDREFHPTVVAQEFRYHYACSELHYWEAARRMTWARESMAGNEWVLWAEKEAGVSRREAYRMLKVGRTFAAIGGPGQLLSLGKNAIFQLASSCEPEELERLAAGDEVEELGSHDDIERMSIRQLKKKLRDREKDLEAEQGLRETAQRKLEAAHAELDQVRLADQDDDQAKKAEITSVENDLLLGLSKTKAWITRQDWPSASPFVRSKGAALLAQLNQYIRDIREDMERLGMDDLLPAGFDAVKDMRCLMDDIADDLDEHVGSAIGADEFTMLDICGGRFRGTVWDEDVVIEAMTEIEEKGFAETIAPGRWRWLGTPDADIPDFLEAQFEALDDDDNVRPLRRD